MFRELKRYLDMRHVYARLLVVVSLTAFAFVGWLSIRQSVYNNRQTRIDEEINKVEAKVESKIILATNALRQMRSYLVMANENGKGVEQKNFEEFARDLNIYETLPGLWGTGFAQVVYDSNVPAFIAAMRKNNPDFKVYPENKNSTHLLVKLLAPLDTRTIKGLGFDFIHEEKRRETVERSIEKDDVQFTPPLEFYIKVFDVANIGFVGFLPVYSSTGEKLATDKRNLKIKGMAFITFGAREMFEGLFGVPDIRHEKITYDIVVTSKGVERTLYKRFDLPDLDGPVRVRKEFNPLLDGWSIHARALPGAFGFLSSNLHNIFAVVAFLLICSIWYSLQSSVSEIRAEETGRQQLVESERRVKDYSRTLLKLNLSIRNILSEIALDRILPAVAGNLRDSLQADAVAIYLRDEHGSAKDSQIYFTLKHLSGALQVFDLNERITLQQIWKMTNLCDVLYASHNNEVFKHGQMFVRRGEYQSFILMPFVDQAEAVVGFALLLSNHNLQDDDFLDSYLSGLVKPIGVALKNSQLYSKAQDAALSKTAFLANMSHEIRTPLGAIVGFSDLLCAEDDIKHRIELKKNIHRNSKLLTRIIDDILDFSKFELSQPVLSIKIVNLGMVIAEVQAVVLMFAQEKNISFKFEVGPGLPEYIETDDIRLKQVLLNLIGNAIKFTDNGEVIVAVSYDASDAQIHFKISDTGSGISREVRERLFQPFSQRDNTYTRRFGGTGLGLVLSRKLAQALGGNIGLVFSEVGRGSIFEAVLPTKAQETIAPLEKSVNTGVEQPSGVSGTLKARNILLVEDSVDNQEIFTLFLQRAGANVDLAKSGDEALIKAATNNYDIILMDIQLPIVDGKQATRILRRRGWIKPIVALTAHALEDERLAVAQAGCDGQITKPVAGSALVFAVKRYLERSEKQIG